MFEVFHFFPHRDPHLAHAGPRGRPGAGGQEDVRLEAAKTVLPLKLIHTFHEIYFEIPVKSESIMCVFELLYAKCTCIRR